MPLELNSDLEPDLLKFMSESTPISKVLGQESTLNSITVGIMDDSDLGRFGPWSIRTASMVNSDLGRFGPLSIRTFCMWSIRTFAYGHFGP